MKKKNRCGRAFLVFHFIFKSFSLSFFFFFFFLVFFLLLLLFLFLLFLPPLTVSSEDFTKLADYESFAVGSVQ